MHDGMLAVPQAAGDTRAMKETQHIEELAARLARAVPGLSGLRQDVERNFRALLGAHLDRFDLVSRERFDTQAELLARTQQQLGALEARIKALESRLPGSGASA